MGNKRNGEAGLFLSQGTGEKIWHQGPGLYNRGHAIKHISGLATKRAMPAGAERANSDEAYWIYGLKTDHNEPNKIN